MASTRKSAHAHRNPAKIPQQPRQRKAVKQTPAEKALAAAKRLKRKNDFDTDIDEFWEYRQEAITRIAKAHSKKEAYVRKFLSNASQFKATRRPSLRNAIIHDLSLKAKERGDNLILEDLQDEADLNEESYQSCVDSMNEAEKTRLINQLIDSRELKRRGPRATEKSAQLDTLQAANGVRDMLVDLFERTGTRGVAIFSRGNADDTAVPNVVYSDEAHLFFRQVLQMDVLDVLRKFEQWCCTQDEGTKERNDISSVRKQIVTLTLDGLRKIKNKATLAMSWADYERDIRHLQGVELAGWPSDITMQRPAKLLTDDARTIRDSLRSGAIHWVPLTKSQKTELAEELSGNPRRRKERSDKGVVRGPRTKTTAGNDSSDEDDEGGDGDGEDGEEEEEGEGEGMLPPAPRKTHVAAPSTGSGAMGAPVPSSALASSVNVAAHVGTVPAHFAATVDGGALSFAAAPSAGSGAPAPSAALLPASSVNVAAHVGTVPTPCAVTAGGGGFSLDPALEPAPFHWDTFDYSLLTLDENLDNCPTIDFNALMADFGSGSTCVPGHSRDVLATNTNTLQALNPAAPFGTGVAAAVSPGITAVTRLPPAPSDDEFPITIGPGVSAQTSPLGTSTNGIHGGSEVTKRKAVDAGDATRASKKTREGTEADADRGHATAKKPRKKRSDAGVPRTARAGGDENGGPSEAPARKQRKKRSDAGVPRAPRASN